MEFDRVTLENLHPSNMAKQKIKSIKVLIVSVDASTRILLRTCMNQWGYEVVETQSDEEAWKILRHTNTLWILMLDWSMPRSGEITLCKRIQNELAPEFRPYVIIMMTLAMMQMDRVARVIPPIEIDFDEFLFTPFNIAELNRRISVGARMMQYQYILVKKDKLLHHHISQVDKLTVFSSDLLRYMLDVLDIMEVLSLAKKSDAMPNPLILIQELRVSLACMIDILNKLPFEEDSTAFEIKSVYDLS